MASLIKRQFKSGPVWYIQYYVGDEQRRTRASHSYVRRVEAFGRVVDEE